MIEIKRTIVEALIKFLGLEDCNTQQPSECINPKILGRINNYNDERGAGYEFVGQNIGLSTVEHDGGVNMTVTLTESLNLTTCTVSWYPIGSYAPSQLSYVDLRSCVETDDNGLVTSLNITVWTKDNDIGWGNIPPNYANIQIIGY